MAKHGASRGKGRPQGGGRRQGDGRQKDGRQRDGRSGDNRGPAGRQQGERPQGGRPQNRRGGQYQQHRPQSSAPATPLKPGPFAGVLELIESRGGCLRDPQRNLAIRGADTAIQPAVISKYGLRGGEFLKGEVRDKEGGGVGLFVDEINGVAADDWLAPPPLEETTAIDPHDAIRFSTEGGPKTMWVLDLFTPIGFGQRGLIVAPPRTGKTILLQQMAHGISTNHPDAYMFVLLVDERPEEVTEMRRNVRGEVFASSNDHDAQAHVRLARLVTERARRMVELGQHIVILLDSITRLARAFNHMVGSSGRTMTGGLDIRALQEPKQIFGAARRIEDGGSLTIIGTALVDTGSRADDFIFQEFKGTGNMELALDRELANLRIWPAVNLQESGTRKEEKLLSPDTLGKVNMLRRQLHGDPPRRQMETLLEAMGKHDTLEKFLGNLRAAP